MFWLDYLLKFIRALNQGASPRQLAWGFVFGWSIGLIPGWPLHVWLLTLLLLLFNINIAMAVAATALASAIGWVFDPLLHALGHWLLVDATPPQGIWVYLYNNPLAALTRFNNTVVLGATVTALVLAPALYFASHWAVEQYRDRLLTWVNRLRVTQLVKGSRLFSLYQRIGQ